MYAVIFRATIADFDQEYESLAKKLREHAFQQYNCIDFIALTEGKEEIAISYWPDEEAIKDWKNDAEHIFAQSQGRAKWYQSYKVEVVEIKRSYEFNAIHS